MANQKLTDERVFEGPNLEEALLSATSHLGIPQANLNYEIVEQGRRGVFGLGAKSVRIRIVRTMGEPRPTEPSEDEHDGPTGSLPDEQAQEIAATLTRMLDLMGLDLEVTVETHGRGTTLAVDGPDRTYLSDNGADLLRSLQTVLNRMARRTWPGSSRVQLACKGTVERRDDELIEMAREVAREVARTGRTRRLHPMNSYERRLVHLAVREFPGLSSCSDGQGSLKRVRISKVQNAL